MIHEVLPLRRQSQVHDDWLMERLTTVVPEIMERTGIDCWVLIAREYNEDPVVKTMLPATWITARRRTILVFTDFGRERIAISRYGVGAAFPSGWSPDAEPDQWRRLGSYLAEKNPQRVAVNYSETFALADGMTTTEHEALKGCLPTQLASRIEPADELAIGWLETRSVSEMAAYPNLCARAHDILKRALSSEVITADTTTTTDVEWWMRQAVPRLGYRTWCHPAGSVQRRDASRRDDFASHPGDETIK